MTLKEPPWSVDRPPSFGGVIYVRKNGFDSSAEHTLEMSGNSESDAFWLATELNDLERLRRGAPQDETLAQLREELAQARAEIDHLRRNR